jgi:hypothetical protein
LPPKIIEFNRQNCYFYLIVNNYKIVSFNHTPYSIEYSCVYICICVILLSVIVAGINHRQQQYNKMNISPRHVVEKSESINLGSDLPRMRVTPMPAHPTVFGTGPSVLLSDIRTANTTPNSPTSPGRPSESPRSHSFVSPTSTGSPSQSPKSQSSVSPTSTGSPSESPRFQSVSPTSTDDSIKKRESAPTTARNKP